MGSNVTQIISFHIVTNLKHSKPQKASTVGFFISATIDDHTGTKSGISNSVFEHLSVAEVTYL